MMRLMWKKLILCITIMTGLIVIGTRLPILTLVALAFGVFVMFQNDEDSSLAFLIFIMPMATIFKLSITSPAFFTYLELFFVLMHFFRKRLRMDTLEVYILIFGAYLAVCQFANGGIDINVTIKFVAHLYILYIASNMDLNKHYKTYLFLYVFGVIVSSIIANMDPFLPVKNYVIPEGYYNAGEYIGRFTGLYKDPNYYCINVIISLCILVLLFAKADISLLSMLMLAAPLFYFAIATVSKSAILMIVIPIIFFLYASAKRKKYGLLIVAGIAFIVTLQMALENRIPALETIMTRLLNSTRDIDSFTTHRMDLWKMYFDFFSDNPLHNVFGSSINKYTLNGAAPHNTYIDMIYQLGIVGSSFLLLLIFKIIQNKSIFIKRGFVNYGVLLCVLIMYGMLSELQYFDPPFHLIMIYITLNISYQNDSISIHGGR